MPFSADVAAQQIQERLKSLHTLVQGIEGLRQQSEQSVTALQRYSVDDKNQNSQKLKSLHKTALTHTEVEEDAIRTALQKIYEIRNIKNERRIQTRHSAANKESVGTFMKMLQSSAKMLPLWVGKVGENPPSLCGVTPPEPSYIAKVGDMVAALVKVPTGEDLILAEVVSFNHHINKYEVDDVIAEHNQKCRHTLSKRRVVPLPLMRANPETHPEALYPQGTFVRALFPQTSCFYKALVSKPPASHTDDYELLFEDLSYPEGYSPPSYVAQRYVITLKQKTVFRTAEKTL